MDGTGFLKTVNFGGFDKKDVLAYVDQLNTKIYTLENELEEKKALLENSGGNMEDKEKYEQLLASDKAKITELQTSNDSLKNQLKNCEDESAEKDKEIEELKKKLADMENELVEAKNKAAAASSAENSAMDLTNVFVEAQRTASTIVTQAKENARKMDEDAKKLANQVVDDANSKASTIVKSADEKASKILTDAEDRSAEMRTAADNMKAVVLSEIADIESNVTQLKGILDSLTKDSLAKVNETADLLTKTQDTLKKNGIPQFTAPKSVKTAAPVNNAKPAPAPAPAAKPMPTPFSRVPASFIPLAHSTILLSAPAPTPAANTAAAKPASAPKPTPKLNNNFGFDLSEIEKMAKAIEADASKHNKGTPVNDDYDGTVDAKKIKLSDMG